MSTFVPYLLRTLTGKRSCKSKQCRDPNWSELGRGWINRGNSYGGLEKCKCPVWGWPPACFRRLFVPFLLFLSWWIRLRSPDAVGHGLMLIRSYKLIPFFSRAEAQRDSISLQNITHQRVKCSETKLPNQKGREVL
jgi:hypothetical protein